MYVSEISKYLLVPIERDLLFVADCIFGHLLHGHKKKTER